MRKSLACIFLLLANLVLLAHTVIPHHHHDKVVVCVGKMHCADYYDTLADHNSDSKKHRHNDTNSSKECIIKDIYTRVDNNKQISYSYVDKYIELPDFLLFFNTYSSFKSVASKPTTYSQKQYLISYYPVSITHSIGLRAPPFC